MQLQGSFPFFLLPSLCAVPSPDPGHAAIRTPAETYYSIREKGQDPAHVNSQWVVEMQSPEELRFLPSTVPTPRSYFFHGADLVTIQTTDPSETGLGHTVWNSGIALAALMTDTASAWSEDLNGKKVLELGAGPALTGPAPQTQLQATAISVHCASFYQELDVCCTCLCVVHGINTFRLCNRRS